MGKYSASNRRAERPKQRGIHPVWQGIGCVLMLIVPVFSYAVADALVEYGVPKGWPIPTSWLLPPEFYPWMFKLTGLAKILYFLISIRHIKANLVITLVLLVIFGGIMSVIYSLMHRMFGPPRDPMDLELSRPRVKIKPYKR